MWKRTNPPTFVAIDFETANNDFDSACAVALVRVECGTIIARRKALIRPDTDWFKFTCCNGIALEDVQDEPAFGDVWPDLEPLLDGAEFLAAHNARFDRDVLLACCETADLDPPDLPFVCTVKLARRTWGLPSNKLPDVCDHLGIPLNHHEPLSDAEACARILLAAQKANPSLLLSGSGA